MSVVFDRPISSHVFDCFDRPGRLLLVLFTGCVPGDSDLYSWTIFSDFDLVWLAAPLTHLLLGLCGLLFRGTPILAGGIGVARVVVGAVFGVGLRFRAIVSQ